MTRLAALSLALLALAACERGPERVVLLTIDTLRADHVGCYGAQRAETAALDALAARGVRFERAVSPAPLTLPSHTTILTGLNPPQHGVRDNAIFRLADDVPTLAERFRAGGYATAAFLGATVLDRRHGLERGFDVYGDDMGLRSSGKRSLHFPERRADEVVDAVLAWLEIAPEKFFLWVHVYDPHEAYDPPEPFASRHASAYAGEVAFASRELGRLLAAVDRRWSARDTLVVLTADHGEGLGEHGSPTHAFSIYGDTQQVPLIFAGPGVPSGTVVAAQVRLADVAPTLLAMAGLDELPLSSGRDLRPLWAGSDREPRAAYAETLATQLLFGWSPLLGVRGHRYQYVRAPTPELYDLERDPGELDNVIAKHPEVAARLDAQLDDELAGARPVRPSLSLSDEDRARLQSLGYVGGSAPRDATALGRVGGADAKDKLYERKVYREANQRLAAGDPAGARELLATIDEPGAMFSMLRAEASRGLGDYEDVIEYAGRVIAQDAYLDVAYSLLAQAEFGRGNLAEARVALEQALVHNPASSGTLLGLASLHEELGEPSRAEEFYRRAVLAREGSVNATVRLAAFLLRSGRGAEADALLAELPRDADPDPDSVIQLARAEAGAGRADAALARLERARFSTPESRKLAFAYAIELREAGRSDDALLAYRAVLALDPGWPPAQNNIAWLLAERGEDLDRALELAQGAARATGDDPAYLDTLATVQLRREEPGEALATTGLGLERAEGETRARLLFVQAQAFARLGNAERAREALRGAFAASDAEDPPDWLAQARSLAVELGYDE